MISTGNRKPLYDGAPVPTRAPLDPPPRRSADHPSYPAAAQVDDVLQTAGERPDPRDAQITRLKNEVTTLRQRLTESASTIDELTEFRTQALAQLAAQHDEITRLRASTTAASHIRRLPQRAATTGSHS